jgi:molybdopterin-biosynthesis enzyme MoeA-like protein
MPSKAQAIVLFVVGDEILSGKRADRHLPKVIELLSARGLELAAARFLADDEAQIAGALRECRDAIVLCCGGIGATPDDCTRQAAARACGLPLQAHAEAVALIEAEYGEAARPNRVRMAEFPQGAGLIPNPVNRVAGFFVADHNFVPGFPEMAWPMLEWVLDTRYAHLRPAAPAVEFRLRVTGASEGDLLDLMQRVLAARPGLKLSSLPFRGGAARPRHIEFGFRGPAALAAGAFREFRAGLVERGLPVEDLAAPL